MGLRLKATFLTRHLPPAGDRTRRYAQDAGNERGRLALLDQLNGPNPPPLQSLRAAVRSHGPLLPRRATAGDFPTKGTGQIPRLEVIGEEAAYGSGRSALGT